MSQVNKSYQKNKPSFCQNISRLGLNIWQKSFKNPEKTNKRAGPNKSVQGGSLVKIK